MAHFEGTIKEFTKFIGAYARIKVMHIAASHKRQVGKCENCGVTKGLEVAHINGQERPVIISNILSQFIENNIVKVDLNEFEETFVQAHIPFEKTVRILCRECHRIYDNSKVIHELVPEAETVISSAIEQNEGQVIEELITKNMNKPKAINIGRTKGLTSLDNSNTIFSNVNSAQDVWWLEPNNEKLKHDLHVVLNDNNRKTLYFFKIPANTIKNPEQHFRQRDDRVRTNCSQIYIPVSGTKFTDTRGFDFTKFLVETIAYGN
ncbi:MAG: hypothetical protein ICV66_10935 [Chitinophagaceae bacterium]|nr:hypothetical protein [Chitinophagaceae bacterium]